MSPIFARRDPALDYSSSDDNRYWRKLLYMFELSGLSSSPSSIFRVLLLGPSNYSYKANFSSDKTIGQWGGKHIYEQGVIFGQIQLDIDPGAKTSWQFHDNDMLSSLSGHGRMLQIWTDIIEPYSRAKATAAGRNVRLRLHVEKDGKVFEVIPDVFSFQRVAGKPAQNPYSVALTVTGEGKSGEAGFDELTSSTILNNQAWSTDFEGPSINPFSSKDKAAAAAFNLRAAVQAATSAVQRVNSQIAQYKSQLQGYTAVIGDVQVLLDACSATISATSDLIRYPLQAVRNLLLEVEHAGAVASQLPEMFNGFKDDWGQICDSLDRIAMFPEKFVNPLASILARNLAQQDPETSGLRVGPAASRPSSQGSSRAYAGWSHEVVVLATDTTQGLANRYRVPWGDIAAANRLRPPYLSPVQLPGCVSPGQRIIVPAIPDGLPPIESLSPGAAPGESQQGDVFGRDFQFDESEGFTVDSVYGSGDLALVGGVANVTQALGYKLQTLRGDNLVFPSIGRQGDVGAAVSIELLVLQETFVKQALLQDARLARVDRVTVGIEGDTLSAEFNVTLRDGSTVRSIGQLEQ